MPEPISETAATAAWEEPADEPALLAPVVWYRRLPVQRRVRLVGRLVSMSPGEIAHRIGRRIAKRRARPQAAPDAATAAVLVGAAMARDPGIYLTGRTTPRGFFDVADREGRAARARAQCPHAVARTLRDAASILRDGVELLGRRFRPADVDFDWQADPELGRVWPLRALDDADAVRGVTADVKFVWEVNRHQFLVTLARACAYGGDARNGDAVVAMVHRWIAANSPGLGVNWASNLEVAIRALAWVWSLHFLLGTPALTPDALCLWLASLRQHRDHLVRHLSTYTDPTNHLIGEAAALAVLALWLPEWDESRTLRALALTTLARECSRQVGADGVGREQAMSYQRFVLDLLLQVIALAKRNGVEVPALVRTRASAMADAIRALAPHGERAPRIGDSDDARGLPFFTEDPWDFGEIVATADAVLSRATPAVLHESTLWLAPEEVLAGAPAETAVTSLRVSRLLGEGGYAVLRIPRGRLIFDCGPLGYPPHASHGHADLLSVLVDVDGTEILIDPGTCAYAGTRRNLFRCTRMHNTVEVGGRDQADAFDQFKWLNLPRVGLTARRLGTEFDYVEAWHDGYTRLRPAVRHRRGVLGVAGGWLVIDWLEGLGEHRFARAFHAAPDVRLEASGGTAVRLGVPSGRSALVVTDVADRPGVCATRVSYALEPYSERYAHVVAAPVVRFLDRAPLPALRVTLLAAEIDASTIALESVEGSRAAGALRLRLRAADGAHLEVALRTSGTPRVAISCQPAAGGTPVVFRGPDAR